MYITRRMGRVAGMGGMQWAIDITKAVQEAGGMTSLWAGGPGSMPGTVAWSSMVDSFAAMVEMQDAIMGSPAYQALLAQAGDHIVSIEADSLLQVVHGEITGQAEVGSFLGAVNAVADSTRGMDAMAWAPSIADAWTAATGLPCVVVTNAAGPMSEIGWLVRFENAAAVDAANAKVAASAEYMEVYAGGAGLFESGGNQMYARRIA